MPMKIGLVTIRGDKSHWQALWNILCDYIQLWQRLWYGCFKHKTVWVIYSKCLDKCIVNVSEQVFVLDQQGGVEHYTCTCKQTRQCRH